ncbi:heavy-metal-associated domain-containing protein [Mycolicibacterium poriferae]|jgi:copper chaperone CopZ|uniref:heavy-metal-associated domain-containing protein n=1 Tax=Mycolicibacterium poriferae TaxID=39694 RepID=UPI001268BFAA|nr:heavy metal-associated domain-containing protein [Mycolicibacterium poriferae]QFS93016.1 Copper chaperone CopZ [Mycobacterium sp. THAF192]
MSTTTITVTGMSCDACASAVRAELTSIPGVVDVDIDLSDGKVTIGSDAPVDDATLRNAVEEAGYELAN